jgi:hypothetical protein
MSKPLMFAVLLSTFAIAFAQDATTPTQPRRPVVENTAKVAIDPKYCIYDDKKFSEGAIKTADGRSMICMQTQTFTLGEPKELYWENAESARGNLYLRPATGSKK